jgi:hypothetical protein
MDLKDKIEKLAFNFEDEDGTLKNSTIFLTDLFEIPEIKQLLIQRVVSSACTCGRMKKCGQRSGLCPETGIWHT